MRRLVAAVAILAALIVVRDPPWGGRFSSGFRPWEEDPPGTRFRWTAGRATFFVPSDATTMTVPLRTEFAGPAGAPTEVQLFSDDRWLTTVRLPALHVWVTQTLPIGGRTTRRYRRIDLRVNRVVPPFMLGVMVGEIQTTR
ncbi:MAG TPA: hypothetical protein VFA27_00400 [Vicinamibacterales bacterium]|nr:hypothetical protein [Vicinamibacterales bacterium]